ncbi:hypothetical protein ABT142_19095 [Streptomyces sp. NPDC001857]|uniref:hypothetical protein n=1 Tax=unclassified Streptomyces TaxID=2593676 RepID=UPI00332E542C
MTSLPAVHPAVRGAAAAPPRPAGPHRAPSPGYPIVAAPPTSGPLRPGSPGSPTGSANAHRPQPRRIRELLRKTTRFARGGRPPGNVFTEQRGHMTRIRSA